MKATLALVAALLFLFMPAARGGELPVAQLIEPAYPVQERVQWVLDIAAEELGYTEQRGGVTKYGQWAGDPKAEWCAEFLCWVVDQADQRHGTRMLTTLFPRYGGTNTGRDWFLREGRYIARKGFVSDWGSQWYRGSSVTMERNSYIPQPGDWVFFSYGSTGDTSHVAMVESAWRQPDGQVLVQVLEGNNPSAVTRVRYPLDDWRIQGYGTVRDLADIVLRMGLRGKKVSGLQQRLVQVALLNQEDVTGHYSQRTSDAIKAFQQIAGYPTTGIANQKTQLALEEYAAGYKLRHSSFWVVSEPTAP
ncbi:MAG: CHAP domain-containing protein [Clostridiales bacterium]|nr:CHAP domain-containing protein [Clostridiales bacterium]